MNVINKCINMKPIDFFEEEGFLIVAKMSREGASEKLGDVMKYYPNISACIDDHGLSRELEIFYAKLKGVYPDVFLMDMYGMNYFWQKIDGFYKSSKSRNITTKEAAIKIYEILFYLYQAIPHLKRLDEMPSVSVENALVQSATVQMAKGSTENKIVRKVESALSLAKDVYDFINVDDIERYYKDLKKQLDKESALKNNTKCEFEKVLYQKCLDELEKCKENKLLPVVSGVDNVKEIIKES